MSDVDGELIEQFRDAIITGGDLPLANTQIIEAMCHQASERRLRDALLAMLHEDAVMRSGRIEFIIGTIVIGGVGAEALPDEFTDRLIEAFSHAYSVDEPADRVNALSILCGALADGRCVLMLRQLARSQPTIDATELLAGYGAVARASRDVGVRRQVVGDVELLRTHHDAIVRERAHELLASLHGDLR